ncbi:hypothetical protein ACP8HZ_10795 [Francisella noatunensis]
MVESLLYHCGGIDSFWLITVISFYGLKANKYLVYIGGILGSFIPAIVIIVLGVAAYLAVGHSATDFSVANIAPHVLARGTIFLYFDYYYVCYSWY